MHIRVLSLVKHNGTLYYPNDVISDIPKKEAERLIVKNIAKETAAVETKNQDETIKLPDTNQEDLYSVLDLNFNTDELKAGATEQDIEFKANISKKALIELIIKNQATDYFMELLED